MIYTVLVTVEVAADNEHEAYGFVRHAIQKAAKAEIVLIDQEVTGSRPDNDDEPHKPKEHAWRTLTRQERSEP